MSDQFKDLDIWKNDPNMQRIDAAMNMPPEKAKAEIEAVLKILGPKGFKYAHALDHLGVILDKMGEKGKAKELWTKALADLDGQVDVDARRNLSKA